MELFPHTRLLSPSPSLDEDALRSLRASNAGGARVRFREVIITRTHEQSQSARNDDARAHTGAIWAGFGLTVSV